MPDRMPTCDRRRLSIGGKITPHVPLSVTGGHDRAKTAAVLMLYRRVLPLNLALDDYSGA